MQKRIVTRLANKIRHIYYDHIARIFHKNCRIKSDDVLVCSFPKSGRTWIRFFIASYIDNIYGLGIGVDWDNFVQLSPGPLCNKYSGLLNYPNNIPRVIFSHDNNIGRFFKKRKVVYITRNIFDIIVSYYHFHKHRNHVKYQEMTLDEFATKAYNLKGAVKQLNYFTKELNKTKEYIIIPYEIMRQDPDNYFRNIIDFIGFDFNQTSFDYAINRSSFESMQKMEINLFKKENGEALHVRRGEVNKYIDSFNEETIKYISDYLRNNLHGVLKQYYLAENCS